MTDTNSGISVEQGKEHGIFVLPMPVMVDGVDYLEGDTITHVELYEALLAEKDVMTAQPSLKDLLDFWDKILEEGYDEIVYIPMSSGLSGSCHTALQFAEEYDGKVQVVDNHRISVTLSDSVYDAKALADKIEEAFPKLNGGVQIYPIGATIGCHTGPGTVALFFWGDERVD